MGLAKIGVTEVIVKWESRLAVIERIVAQEVEADDRWARLRAETEQRVNVMLVHVPESLQDAVIDKINEGGKLGDQLWEWLNEPFVKGAPPIAPDFRFPAEFVKFLLAPPRDIWIGHSCQSCGLQVPIYKTWTNDPDPPAKLSIFPDCPACDGKTKYWVKFDETST